MFYLEERLMEVADFGAENPMPDIGNVSYIRAGFDVTDRLSEDEKRYLGQGMIRTILPYTQTDNYTRERKMRPVKVVRLENEYLRAEFLPEYGGRLWSLTDKTSGINVLYTNTVLQPCNFAIRNAWFSGGVEFNVGMKGHTPLTCSPMHCERIGECGVRFFEFERIRGVAYSFTAWLPSGAKSLYLRPVIENTSKKTVPMYWWSNIAFPETEKTRVLVPATEALRASYAENHYLVDKAKIPQDGETDVSYPLSLVSSADYFFEIPKEENKWIAAVDPNGRGLLHRSDKLLRGRKLFLWGSRAGGRHWNEFLSERGQAYFEIQAGLATTQLEHLPMPPETTWSWTESYTPVSGTCEAYYGDYETAVETMREQERALVSRGDILSFEALPSIRMEGETELLLTGSGFGALENRLRAKAGEAPVSRFLQFPEVHDRASEEWYSLLENGYLPCPDHRTPPPSYEVGEGWLALLERSVSDEKGAHWYTYLQLGVARYATGNIEGAKDAFLRSASAEPNVWAYRNLAMLSQNELRQKDNALADMKKAFTLSPAAENLSFLKEYAKLLTDLGEYGEWTRIYRSLPESLRENGRLRIYLVKDLLGVGDVDGAAKLLTPDFVLCDVKEGELSLSALWKEIHTAKIQKERGVGREEAERLSMSDMPLPYSLDFRMHD